jgi:hypothetical protein
LSRSVSASSGGFTSEFGVSEDRTTPPGGRSGDAGRQLQESE